MNAEYMSRSLDQRAADSHLPYQDEVIKVLYLIVISSSMGPSCRGILMKKEWAAQRGRQVNDRL